MDCEKLLGLAFTGMNTKNSLMTVRMKTEQSNRANRFHILLTSEQILEVSDAGISVFD
jgi:16S rRNA C1402 (ribose-2'-O) methylase RsmI